ncbi:MAG: M14 family zinc carboxypeptidase [Wenzhouxiangellaceae bacterium]
MIIHPRFLLLTGAILLGSLGHAATDWPQATYAADVPDFHSTLGYAPGEVISSHAQMRQFFQALQQARPQQLRLIPYARSWQGRELFYAVIGSAENIARLDAIGGSMRELAAARLDQEQATQLMDDMPAGVWLAYAVHGNEISSTDAAMMTAYHLLAADQDEDETVREILANTLIFIDPLQNPDGRDRFVHAFRQSHGLAADADRYAAEHDEPWPGGRTNHYHFDLNRDWIALTQPETRGRVKALLDWYPQVFVDAHEMGSDSTYYFAPEAVPYNPHIAPAQRAKLPWFGRNNAAWFDRYGIDYFTREIFDAFYPGYGASWPLYFGAIAMTYEQASSRGLIIRRSDGRELSYGETVRNHFLTSLATAQTAARNRRQLLEDFYRYRRDASDAGRKGRWREYLLDAGHDASAAHKLATLLHHQGVTVRRARQAFSACGADYAAGSYAIDLAQPAHRLIRTLLDPQVAMDETFLREQERRRAQDQPDEIYDVTAWSLPLMFNVPLGRCERPVSGEFSPHDGSWIIPGEITGASADSSYAYLVRWGSQAAARLLSMALREPLQVLSSDRPFTKDGQAYPAGTLIIKSADNPPDLQQTLSRLSESSGAAITAVSDSWIDDGPNFGSQHVNVIHPPRIALLWDDPTSAPGQTRYVLERQYHYPVSAIRSDTLARADLQRYQVIILPEAWRGDYRQQLTTAGVDKLRRWVNDGGTLIALGNAVAFLADPETQLSALRREDAWRDSDDKNAKSGDDKSDSATVPGSRLSSDESWRKSLMPRRESPDYVSGALVYAEIGEDDHWLNAGLPDKVVTLSRGNQIYAPLKLDQGRNVLRYAAADELLASGYLWEENRLQLAYKPFVSIEERGAGFIIAFTADPNYRAYLDGLNIAFLNAVFRAPAHARVIR